MEVAQLQKDLKSKLISMAASSPSMASPCPSNMPLQLHLAEENSGGSKCVTGNSHEARKITKNIGRKARRSSGADSLGHLKFLMTQRESLKHESQIARDQVVTKYSNKAKSLSDSLIAIKEKCSKCHGEVERTLSRLLEGRYLVVPSSEWAERTDRPLNAGKRRLLLDTGTLRQGLVEIIRAISRGKPEASFHPNDYKLKKRMHSSKKSNRSKRGPQSAPKGTTRRRESLRESMAVEQIMPVFPFLTKNQAKFALLQCGDDAQTTINWLLSKNGSSLDWACRVEPDPVPTSINSEKSREESLVVKILGARTRWLYCVAMLDQNRNPLQTENAELGYLPMQILVNKQNGTNFGSSEIAAEVKVCCELPDLT